MPDYKEMYFKLARALADAIEDLDELSFVLKTIQRNAEEMFVQNETQ